jgi:hypothetical protein
MRFMVDSMASRKRRKNTNDVSVAFRKIADGLGTLERKPTRVREKRRFWRRLMLTERRF